MQRSLNIIIGDHKIALLEVSDDCCSGLWLFKSIEEFDLKFSEMRKIYDYDIKLIIDTDEQSFTSDTLFTVTEHSFLHSVKPSIKQSYNDTQLTGFFILENHERNHLENRIITITANKTDYISSILSQLKKQQNTIKSITSMTVELQQICVEIKREFVTIHYDQSDIITRSFIEYDIYAMQTLTGMLRYLIFKNESYDSCSHTIIPENCNQPKLLAIISNDISNILRKINPSINDQLNLYVCLNNELLVNFTEFTTKVDRLILVEVDKLAKNLHYTLQGENNKEIDQIIAILLDHKKPITNIADYEFEKIISLEHSSQLLRWPTLIISCLVFLSLITFMLIDNYQTDLISTLTQQSETLGKQTESLQRQNDILLSHNNLDDIFYIYQEIASYQDPFSLLKHLSELKSQNLEFIDFFWSNSNKENIMGGSIYTEATLIANIKTDSDNSFDSIVNNFITHLTNLNSSYIINYSRPTDQILNLENGDNNPLIIKIRCVSKK